MVSYESYQDSYSDNFNVGDIINHYDLIKIIALSGPNVSCLQVQALCSVIP